MKIIIGVQAISKLSNLRKGFFFLTVLSLCGLCGLYAQVTPNNGVVYVAPNGTGTGWDWVQAASIENAIGTAPEGTELRLRGGTYNITTTLSVARRITINGGYTGADLTARNPTTNPSVLDGGNARKVITLSANGAIVNGVIIQRGYAPVGEEYVGSGGMEIRSANNITISNVIFKDNVAENRMGSAALYLWSSDNIVVEDCVFENNRVITNVNPDMNIGGGALHIRFGTNTKLINSRFINNESVYEGGAIHSWGKEVMIDGCSFEGNKCGQSGGAIYIRDNDVLISNSTFTGNKSQALGGAVYNSSGQITVRQSNFMHNTSEEGGAIYTHRSAKSSLVERCHFTENSATTGGAIYNLSDLEFKVISSLFNRNRASDLGGAIYNTQFITVANSTFVGNNNTALVHNRYKTSSYNTYRTNIYNSIFYLNTAKSSDYRADIAPLLGNGTDVSDKDIRQNIVQAYSGGSANLVGVNPLFVDNSNNFSLQQGSPAADKGNNTLFNQVSSTAAGESRDLANSARFFGAAIDMGAYELQQQSTPDAPNCTNITSPTNDATGVALLPAITWNAVANTTGYRLYIGTTAGGSDILDGQNVGNVTSYTLTTALNNNTLYYVRVIPFNTVGSATDCEEIIFRTIAQLPPPPTADAQTFCGTSTVTDLVAQGTNLRWYLAATGGTVLAMTTVLQTRSYYVSQTVNGMESTRTQVSVTVHVVNAPSAVDQRFCASATVSNLQATGTGIRWYTQAAGGVQLAPSTVLTTRTYYVSQTIGTCESPRTAVAVTIVQVAPPKVSAQSFCRRATVADLQPADATIRWYDQATGGAPLDLSTALQSGTYYVSRVSGNCESERTAVDITVRVTPIPTIPNQSFTPGATFDDLDITGVNIRWYDSPTGTNVINPNATIQDGTFYVTQTIDGCESDRAIIVIEITRTSYSYTFKSATFAYNGDKHSLTLSGNLPPNAEVVYTNNGRTDAGSQQVSVTVSAPGVDPVTLNANLTITPAVLRVIAEPKRKTYADSDPTLTYQLNGLRGDDDASVVTGHLVRQVGENTGIYAIEQGSLQANGNYTVQFVGADLTITARDIRIVISNQSKIYGDQDPALTYDLDINIPTSDISGQPVRNVGENVGSYTIGVGSLTVTSNYNIVAVQAGQLFISPAQLVVRARDTVKTLDFIPFIGGNGFEVIGLKRNDKPADLQGKLLYGGNSQGAISLGTFNIEVSGLLHPNYTISFVAGSLRIEGESYFPNVITPNGDGLNDTFVVKKTNKMLKVSILVFNTDGLEVYCSKDYQDDFSGTGLNKGTYLYVLHYSFSESPHVYIHRKGFLTIL